MEKVCNKCGILKDISEFTKNKECSLGVSGRCKSCTNKYLNEWMKENPDKCKIIQKRTYEKNITKKHAYQDNYRITHKAIIKERRTKFKEKDSEGYLNYFKEYKNRNRERLIPYRRQYKKNKRETDIGFRLKDNLRSRFISSLKQYQQKGLSNIRTQHLISCTFDFLISYLEERFLPTMTWENYGEYWHIDHIIPCCNFDLTKKEEQKKCFHYSNLQPLFAKTQIINGVKYIGNLNKNKHL